MKYDDLKFGSSLIEKLQRYCINILLLKLCLIYEDHSLKSKIMFKTFIETFFIFSAIQVRRKLPLTLHRQLRLRIWTRTETEVLEIFSRQKLEKKTTSNLTSIRSQFNRMKAKTCKFECFQSKNV